MATHDILALLEKALAEAGDDPLLRAQVLPHLAENEAVNAVRQVARADERAAEAVALGGTAAPTTTRSPSTRSPGPRRCVGGPSTHLIERYSPCPPNAPTWPGARNESPANGWSGAERSTRRVRAHGIPRPAEEGAEAYALERLHLCELELRAGAGAGASELLDEWADSPDSGCCTGPCTSAAGPSRRPAVGDVDEARRWADRPSSRADATGVRWDWFEAHAGPRAGGAARQGPRRGRVGTCVAGVGPHPARGRPGPRSVPRATDLVEALVETEDLDAARMSSTVLALAGRRTIRGRGGPRGAAVVELATPAAYGRARGRRRSRPPQRRTAPLDCRSTRPGRCSPSAGPAPARVGRRARRARTGPPRLRRRSGPPAGPRTRVPSSRGSAPAEPSAGGGLTADRASGGRARGRRAGQQGDRAALVVTVNTVEFHLRNTYAKLGIRSRVQLAAAAGHRRRHDLSSELSRNPLWIGLLSPDQCRW